MLKRLTILGMFTAASCGLALAQVPEPRKIDFSQVLLSAEGKPFTYCYKADPAPSSKCADERDITLEYIVLNALQMRFQDEPNLSGKEQVRRAALALKIHQNKKVAVSSDDTTMIKDLIAKLGYNTVAVYRAYQFLDPAGVPDAKP